MHGMKLFFTTNDLRFCINDFKGVMQLFHYFALSERSLGYWSTKATW